ncbi:MAG TPA: SRPBCC domain-containing protein [Solirubrobacteraceae bacterium]|nr:SRPBCC domain-containing protein [Solirubrobacteraceae bacterium]
MALTLEIKRIVPAAPPVVFGAFSTPEELAQWWGPHGFTAPSLDFNPSVGDRYRIEMQPPDGDPFYLTGEFREVDPPGRLAYTFSWEDPDPDDRETLVELSFRDLGESTEVVITQGPFNTAARRELHRNGWTDSLDKLEQSILGSAGADRARRRSDSRHARAGPRGGA